MSITHITEEMAVVIVEGAEAGIHLIKQEDKINSIKENQEKIIKLLMNLYFSKSS